MPAKLTSEQFIEKAIATHGDRYDYKKTVYESLRSNIIVTCKQHGDFIQNARVHIRSNGCPKCRTNRKFDKVDFIEKAVAIHGDRYSYDLVVYEGNGIKVDIVCSKHGIFSQVPCTHWKGIGCPACANLMKKGSINNTTLERDSELANSTYWLYNVKFTKDGVSLYKVGLEKHKESRWGKTYKGWHVEYISSTEGRLRDLYDIEQQTIRDNEGIRYQHCDFIGNGATEMFKEDPWTL